VDNDTDMMAGTIIYTNGTKRTEQVICWYTYKWSVDTHTSDLLIHIITVYCVSVHSSFGDWKRALDHSNKLCVAFFDVSKTVDTVPLLPLLQKLRLVWTLIS